MLKESACEELKNMLNTIFLKLLEVLKISIYFKDLTHLLHFVTFCSVAKFHKNQILEIDFQT